MSRSNLKYHYDDQTKQILNEAFEELEALINLSSEQKKEEQYAEFIVNIFEKILDNNANI